MKIAEILKHYEKKHEGVKIDYGKDKNNRIKWGRNKSKMVSWRKSCLLKNKYRIKLNKGYED